MWFLVEYNLYIKESIRLSYTFYGNAITTSDKEYTHYKTHMIHYSWTNTLTIQVQITMSL